MICLKIKNYTVEEKRELLFFLENSIHLMGLDRVMDLDELKQAKVYIDLFNAINYLKHDIEIQ